MDRTHSAADDEPFGGRGAAKADAARLLAGNTLGEVVDADLRKRVRARIEAWAKKRHLAIQSSTIARTIDAIEVRVPLYEVTSGTAVVRASASLPARLSFSIEPKTCSRRLRERVFSSCFSTGDPTFDRAWHVVTSDPRAGRELLDDRFRATLSAFGAWCRVTYSDGEIEMRVDVPEMTGGHLLRGMDVVAAAARARTGGNAYR